jgi:peroxiredoxin
LKQALRLALLAAAAVAAAFGYARLQQGTGGLRAGMAAPDFTLPARGGGTLRLASLRGRVVVLNFWATWCPPCVAEMPSLERLHRALGQDGLAVLGVSVDEDDEALARFVAKAGLTFPILRDPGGAVAWNAYGTASYPATFVIDASGRIQDSYLGAAEWDSPDALAHFRLLLRPADRPAAPPSPAGP